MVHQAGGQSILRRQGEYGRSQAERIRQQTRAYLDRHGWDAADDEAAWRRISAAGWRTSTVTMSGEARVPCSHIHHDGREGV